MKNFKIIDFWVSIFLIIISAGTIYFMKEGAAAFIYCYFIVGTWQVISMIIHSVNGWFVSKKLCRYYYHWISFILLITMPRGSFFMLLYIAPLMAIVYTLICIDEVINKMKRPISLLK